MSVEDTLVERNKTHGDYDAQADGAQRIKFVMRTFPNWESLTPPQKESLELIATKISRIGHGDYNHVDSWKDISGYAELVCRTIID